MSSAEAQALRQAIAALEAQRGVIGAAAVDIALQPLNERLAALERAAEPQLRQLSLLFIDIADSTAISRELEPEEVHALLDGALKRFTALVSSNGGRVLQYAGDSLLAAFGTPVSREDDAARAVDAALAVLADAQAQGRFSVRAGIATGLVRLGAGVEGEGGIRGAVVNLAARMEQSAPRGGLRICADTRRLVRGLFELEPQPPLALKGYPEPVPSWLVQRRSTPAALAGQAARGVGGVSTPLVGRQAELARLQALWQQQGSGPAAVAVVLGEAGVGKSRLCAEFRAWTERPARPARWLAAWATERSRALPYGVLRQLFARHLGLLDSTAPTRARHTWLAAMAPLLSSASDAAVLGHLLGLDFSADDEVRPLLADTRQLRERAFFHAVQALRRMAAGAELALLIEDLQWVDAGTLDFIEHLQRDDAGVRLVLASARPELERHEPGWCAQPGRRAIELQPLAAADAQALAEALLAPLPQAPPALHQRLVEGAEGYPFHMEELLNMFIDRGVIVAEGEQWQLGEAARGQAAGLPRTLAGVLQARLDELAAPALHALQLAAVVGPVFWADALRALGVGDDALLRELAARRLVVEQPESSLAGQREFAFRHHLLHQVCYERVLRGVKQPAHARVAAWLAQQPGERPLELMAEHLERGGEPAQALEAWHRAALGALARGAHEAALAHSARALALAPADALDARFELERLRVELLSQRADAPELARSLDALDAMAAQRGDAASRAQALVARSVQLSNAGDFAGALARAEAAWQLALGHDPMLAARAGRTRSAALARLGRSAEAREAAEHALALARECGDPGLQGALLNELAGLVADEGDPAQAMRLYAQALALHQAEGNRGYEAGVLSNMGYVDLGVGDYGAAAERFTLAREQFARIGQRLKEGLVGVNLAIAALNDGRPEAALNQAQAALALLGSARSRWGEATALRVAGQAHLALGRADAARDALLRARERFDALGLAASALEANASLARATLAAGDAATAAALADALLATLQQDPQALDGAEEPLRALQDLWLVLDALGDARGPALLEQARSLVLARAQRIADPARRAGFLHRVPYNRVLLEAAAEGPFTAPR